MTIYDLRITIYDEPMTIDEQLAYLRKGTTEIIREEELRAKLRESETEVKQAMTQAGTLKATVSIGVGTNERRTFSHPAQVSELATEMKSYAKTLNGSVYVVDRRQDPILGSPVGVSER